VVSPWRPEPLPERLREDVERRLLSVTRTAATTDPFLHNGSGVNGEVGPTDRSSFPFALCFSDLGLGFGDSIFVDSRLISQFDPFPTVYSLDKALLPLIHLPDRLGVDRVGKHCVWHTFISIVVSFTGSLVKICTRAVTVGVEVECGGAVEHPVSSARPSGSVRVCSGELQWRRQTSCLEPVAPTLSYSAGRQGPTSLLTGWASPIRTRIKAPMGRWVHWWRGQSNRQISSDVVNRAQHPNGTRIGHHDRRHWIDIPLL
jgi:hypothetical protein